MFEYLEMSKNIVKIAQNSRKKPETAKVGAMSKAQKAQSFKVEKGDSLGFLKLQFVAKYEKKCRKPFGDFRKIQKNQSVTVPKNVKGGYLGYFNVHSVEKCRNQWRRTFGAIQKFSE